MDKVITYEMFGKESQVVIRDVSSDAEARDVFTTQLAKFRITNIVTVKSAAKKPSLFATYADGFINSLQKLVPVQ